MASISTALNKQTTTDFAVNEESSTQAATCSDKKTTLANKIYDIDVTKDAKQQKYIQPAATSISTEVETERSDFSKRKAGGNGNKVNDITGISPNGVKATSFKTSVVSVHYYRDTKRFKATMTIEGRVEFVYVSVSYSDMFSHNEALTDKGYTTAAQLQQELISTFKNTHNLTIEKIHKAFEKIGRFDEKRRCYLYAAKPKKSIADNRIISPPINPEYIPYDRVTYQENARVFTAQLTYNKVKFTSSHSVKLHEFSKYCDQENETLTDTGKDIAKNVQKDLIKKLRAAHSKMTLEQQHACFPDSTYDATEACYYKDTGNIPSKIESSSIPVYGISHTCHGKTNPRYYFRFLVGKCQRRAYLNPNVCRKIWDEGNQCLTAYGLELAENTQRNALKKYNNTLPCDNEIIQKKQNIAPLEKSFIKEVKNRLILLVINCRKRKIVPQTQT